MNYLDFENSRYGVRLWFSVEQSVAANQSRIRVSQMDLWRNRGGADEGCISGTVEIDGRQVLRLERAGGTLRLDGDFVTIREGDSGWQGGTVTLTHREDGSCRRAAAEAALTLETPEGRALGGIEETAYLSVPRIPRISGISAVGVELGQTMTVEVSRADVSYTNTLTWSCGTDSGTIAQGSGETVLRWVPPLSLAAQEPNGTAVTVQLQITTYQNGSVAGRNTLDVRCGIPASVVPGVTVQVTDAAGYQGKYGGYVQSQSRARVRTQVTGAYGAGVKSIAVRCGGLAGSGSDVSFTLNASGSVAIVVTVTDTRGRTAVGRQTINVLSYQSPTAAISRLYRCDSSGAAQPDGNYARVVFSGKVTGFGGVNKAVYTLQRRVRGVEAWTDAANPTATDFWCAAGAEQDFEFRIRIRDDFGEGRSSVSSLPAAFALMDFKRSDKSVGIGRRASGSSTLGVGLELNMHGHRITDLGAPAADSDAATVGKVKALLSALYPVGSVYISTQPVCAPAALVGGTWVRVEDRFLLAAGKQHAAGSTGGEETVRLTLEQMPAHSHDVLVADESGWEELGFVYDSPGYPQDDAAYGATGSAGGGQAHNNMPPYLAVYMWERKS